MAAWLLVFSLLIVDPSGAPQLVGVRVLPVSIFVGPQRRDGFVDVDSGVNDSIKDIQNELRGKKRFRVITKKDQAQLVLEAASRGATSATGGGGAALPIGTATLYIPFGTIGIATVLHVGTYQKPIVFTNCEAWKLCARLVVKDIETWVDANESAIPVK